MNRTVIAWIKCFLSNHSRFVKVGHCSSSPCKVLSGVPQGSVLGPVLFVLFVNDICSIVPSGVNLKLFADDVKLYSVINSTVTPNSLQACLSAIHEWSEHWQLKLSPAKCTVLHVSPHYMHNRTMFDYIIGDTTLRKADTLTDLGVTYDRKLSYATHIDTIVAKASLRSKLTLRCFQSRDSGLLMHAFFCQTHLGILFSSLEPCI